MMPLSSAAELLNALNVSILKDINPDKKVFFKGFNVGTPGLFVHDGTSAKALKTFKNLCLTAILPFDNKRVLPAL
jgi:hypothetical protein